MGKRMKCFQCFSLKPLDDTFELMANPYPKKTPKSEEAAKAEAERLRELGVVFYRDEDHVNSAFFESLAGPTDGYYTQAAFDKTGIIHHIENDKGGTPLKNRPCKIVWVEENAVKRIFK